MTASFDRVVLITGAGSGTGATLAVACWLTSKLDYASGTLASAL
jgi:hypothetical protein